MKKVFWGILIFCFASVSSFAGIVDVSGVAGTTVWHVTAPSKAANFISSVTIGVATPATSITVQVVSASPIIKLGGLTDDLTITPNVTLGNVSANTVEATNEFLTNVPVWYEAGNNQTPVSRFEKCGFYRFDNTYRLQQIQFDFSFKAVSMNPPVVSIPTTRRDYYIYIRVD